MKALIWIGASPFHFWYTHLVEVTVNLMTYFPCRAAGTQCTLPRVFIFLRSFSVKVFSPRRRKTTMPRCRFAGISKRESPRTRASNFWAKRTPWNYKHLDLLKQRFLDRNIISRWKLNSDWYLPYVFLKTSYAIISNYKPQFEGPESFGKGDLPVLQQGEKINSRNDAEMIYQSN